MAKVTPNPNEHDVDSSSADSGDANQPLIVVQPPQELETSGNDSGPESDENSVEQTSLHPNGNVTITNPSVGAGEPTETPPSATLVSNPRRLGPADALKEIKSQKTHYLYCSVCKRNITTNAELFAKGKEPYPYNKTPCVVWVPLFIPSWFSHIFIVFTLPSRRFLLPVVLLVLSVTVMWFHDPPVPPPGPLSLPPGLDSYFKIGWLIHLQSSKYLSIFSLLFLAILALLWPSKVHVSQNQDGEPQVSTKKPEEGSNKTTEKVPGAEENKEVVVPGAEEGAVPGAEENKKGVVVKNAVQDNGILSNIPKLISKLLPSKPDQKSDDKPEQSTPDNIVDVLKPAKKPLPLPDVLWNYIVVPVLNLLPRELDILKSIVYGGLIESITSLGVVSSAAASGASTLNVLALGLANLFSGLFLIIHKICELKMNENDYRRWLGDRRKIKFHCVVVVVSFIFFGVIPPLFYGLTFKQTDKVHYKAAVVLVASLVCVISLSFAKAYAFRMERLRTVAEYTGMAIGASALSFIASQLVSDMLEKYGFHELASDYRKG